MSKMTTIFINSILFILVFLIIGSCSNKSPVEPEQPPEAIIPASTKVLDETSLNNLVSISADDSIFVFTEGVRIVDSLSVGDVIVSGVTDKAPYGFLRKVENVAKSDGQLTVVTSQATLEDAIESGRLTIEKTLGPQDLAGNPELAKGAVLNQEKIDTGEFQVVIDQALYSSGINTVKATGIITIEPSFSLHIDISNFRLQKLRFINTTVQTTELQIDGDVRVFSLDDEYEIASFPFQPITIFVGIVPVVIHPLLTIDVGISGSAEVGVIAKVKRTTTLTAGIEYRNGSWNEIHEVSKNLSMTSLTPVVGCSFRGYTGPQMNLLLYGVAGPYADLNGFLEFNSNSYSNPWWELYAGAEVGVGVQIRFLGRIIEDRYFPAVIEFRQLLATAEEVLMGTINGTVKDAVSRSGLDNVSINVTKDNTIVASGLTDVNGNFSIEVQADNGYLVEFTKAGYLPVTYNNVDVGGFGITFLEPILQIDESFSGTGEIGGQIVNALSGAGVSNLNLLLREGINNQTGTVLQTSGTDDRGYYSFSIVPAGNYTVEASGAGYVSTYFSVISIGEQSTGNQNATITPLLNENEIRIILNWGETPRDLDSHLTGPLPDGTRFHMYYPLAETNYNSPWPDFVKLDLDDVTSYGPETTTIYRQISGLYRFSVHDYTNRSLTSSYTLSNSGAQVRVYKGSHLFDAFYVPTNTGGTLWTVFEMYDDTIVPVNAMSYESDPGDVTVIATGTDVELMKNLPSKDK